MPGPVLIRYGARGGLTGGFAAVPQVPGREDERTAAGEGGEGGNRGEQRGGHGDQADAGDRYRDAEVGPHRVQRRGQVGTEQHRRERRTNAERRPAGQGNTRDSGTAQPSPKSAPHGSAEDTRHWP